MVSSEYVNENGDVKCCICHKKFALQDSLDCAICGRFVCKNCSERVRGYGIVCKKCKAELQESR